MEVTGRQTISLLLSLLLVAAVGCNRGKRPQLIGHEAPDFTVADGTSSVHLGAYRGQVVLLNFWAPWCGPCVAEMPALLELHHQMPGIVVLAVSSDTDVHAYTHFLAAHHVDLITVRDPYNSAANLFHTTMYPETYVIDRQGKIRRKFIGAQDWTSPEIRAYLASL